MKIKILMFVMCLFSATLFAADVFTTFDLSDPELGPVYRVRGELLDAARDRDTATVSQKIAELEAMQTDSLITIHDAEKFGIYNELKMYRAMLKFLVQYHKNAYVKKAKNTRYAGNDGLTTFTQMYFEMSRSKKIHEEIERELADSDLDETEIREMRLMLYLPLTYYDNEYLEKVKRRAQVFLSNDGDHPDAEWVRKSIMAPLDRMDFIEMFYKDRANRKEHVIQNSLYTGGLGVNVYLLSTGGGFKNYYRKDWIKPDNYPVTGEIYLQIKRFSISGEFVNSGHKGVLDLGAALGYVVHDSRYLKIRPYIEISGCIFGGNTKVKSFSTGRDDYDHMIFEGVPQGYRYESPEWGTAYTLGVNIDYKFATLYLFSSNRYLSSFSIVGKFGMSYMNLEEDYPVTRGKGLDVFMALGLGVYLW
jgi:hypothetical protein